MKGKSCRDKGLNYERKIRVELIGLGFTGCTTSRYESKKRDDAKVDLCNTGPFNFQCKAIEAGINYHKLLSQMPKEKNFNVVVHKKDRAEVAVLSKSDFWELIQMLLFTKE